MRNKMDKNAPLTLRSIISSPYSYVARRLKKRKKKKLRRNWDLDLSIPEQDQEAFIKSCLEGDTDFSYKTESINIVLCGQPKSASRYLEKLLSWSLNLDNHQIGFNKAGGSIYYPRLLASKFTATNTLSHCHAEASPVVLKMFTNLDIRPVILTRNLLDSLLSRRDMLLRDQWSGNFSSASAMQKFLSGDHEYQMDVIIDLFAGTYINFFTSWDQARLTQGLRPIHITYEEMIENEVALVMRIASELGVEVKQKQIEGTIAKIKNAGGINFSTGKKGRGRDLMTDNQISVLKDKADRLGCCNEEFLGFKI